MDDAVNGIRRMSLTIMCNMLIAPFENALEEANNQHMLATIIATIETNDDIEFVLASCPKLTREKIEQLMVFK